MKRFLLAIAATLTIIGPASAATCTSTSNIGTISTPGLSVFGNSFGSVQHFSDCFTFTLNHPSSAFGFTSAFDVSLSRNIDLSSITLSGGSLLSPVVDTTPTFFSFSNLLSGTYQLAIEGDVTGRNGGFLGGGFVGYGGTIAVVASSVPSPIVGAGLPGLLTALGGLFILSRRRRNQTA
jgi:hypothetical protein